MCLLSSYADIILSLLRKEFQYLVAVLSYDPTKHAGNTRFGFVCLISPIQFYEHVRILFP